MKSLKRILLIAILAFATIGTTACGGNSKQVTKNEYDLLKTMVLEQPSGIKIEIAYYGKGDVVYVQTANNVIPYKAFPGGKEKLKAQLDPIAEKYKGLKGVNHKLDYTEDKLVETLEVKFKELEVEKAKNVPGLLMSGSGDPKNGVSLSKSVELLKQNGYTEKK